MSLLELPITKMASAFDVVDFVQDFESNPSKTKLNVLKRSELFDVAKYYKVSVTAGMRKADLRAVLTEFFCG